MDGWKEITLGELCVLRAGSVFKPHFQGKSEGEIPFIKVSDMNLSENHVYIRQANNWISEEMRAEMRAKTFPIGTTVFAKIGEALRQNRVRLLVRETIIDNNMMGAIPIRSVVDPKFLFYRLEDFDIASTATGTALPYLTVSTLAGSRFVIPPLHIQRRIAGTLSSYDDLIENNHRRIQLLEETARSLYREWFVHFRFPGHDKVKMVSSPLGSIPQGWEVSRLDAIAENFDRLRKPISKMQRAKMQGEYPYYGAAKVFDYVNNFIFDGEYLLMAEDGSVITPDRAPVLQLVNEKFWPNNHTHILRGKAPVSTHFLYLGLSLVDISPYITGAAQPKITQENMNRILFFCGPTELHRDFDRLVVPMIHGSQILQRKNKNLRRTRDLLLPKLLSGGLDVSKFPDQPAEATA